MADTSGNRDNSHRDGYSSRGGHRGDSGDLPSVSFPRRPFFLRVKS